MIAILGTNDCYSRYGIERGRSNGKQLARASGHRRAHCEPRGDDAATPPPRRTCGRDGGCVRRWGSPDRTAWRTLEDEKGFAGRIGANWRLVLPAAA